MERAFSANREEKLWHLRRRSLALGTRTLIMGIVNITPDSFSDGGKYFHPEQAIAHGVQLLAEGADLLDLGAESTRPGALAGDPATAAVSAQQEHARLLPVIGGILHARPDAILSIDTYKAETARIALSAGAEVINDVSGFTWDPQMAQVCAQARCGVIAMHTYGTPRLWAKQSRKSGDELLAMVHAGFAEILQVAQAAGIDSEHIVLDPGYGFGKRGTENYALLARQHELLSFGRPLLAGLSRKSFLGRTVMHGEADAPAASAEITETASVAALVTAILQGASIVRVHSVPAAIAAAAIADAIRAAH